MLFNGEHQIEYALVAVYKKSSALTLHRAAKCSRQKPISNQDSKVPVLGSSPFFSRGKRSASGHE